MHHFHPVALCALEDGKPSTRVMAEKHLLDFLNLVVGKGRFIMM
jgi:hypothetical protein